MKKQLCYKKQFIILINIKKKFYRKRYILNYVIIFMIISDFLYVYYNANQNIDSVITIAIKIK